MYFTYIAKTGRTNYMTSIEAEKKMINVKSINYWKHKIHLKNRNRVCTKFTFNGEMLKNFPLKSEIIQTCSLWLLSLLLNIVQEALSNVIRQDTKQKPNRNSIEKKTSVIIHRKYNCLCWKSKKNLKWIPNVNEFIVTKCKVNMQNSI